MDTMCGDWAVTIIIIIDFDSLDYYKKKKYYSDRKTNTIITLFENLKTIFEHLDVNITILRSGYQVVK